MMQVAQERTIRADKATVTPRIVLFEPVYWGAHRKVQRAPLGLLAISSLLDKEGYSISIVSQTLYDDPDKKVLEGCKNAICFGITALTGYQIADGLRMARLVREAYPNLPIVWGGWHPTIEPETTLESPYVDILVRGVGERTFTELVHALEDGGNLDNIPGVSYKQDGEAYHNPKRPLEDINNFPPMPYHLIEVERVLSNDEFGDRVLNYISSYGCPNKCGFCSEWALSGRKWTGLSAHRMADDFERFVKYYKVDCIAINDNQFYLKQDRVREFCEELLKRNLDVKWDNVAGNIRPLLKWGDEMWELMYQAGCRSMFVGAESGFQDALDLIDKNLTVEETVRFAEKSKKYDIRIVFSLMLGLPWDPDYEKTSRLIDEEIKHTMNLAEKIISISDRHRPSFTIYTPYPGTPLWERALALGVKPPQSLEGWSNWISRIRNTPWVNPKQAKLSQFISEYIFFFLDPTAYSWVTARVQNPLIRLILKGFYKVFIRIAKLRWRFKFFALPIDYWIYRLGREILGIA